MVAIAAGSRLVLRTASGAFPLRALVGAEVIGDWQVVVLAPLAALSQGTQEQGTVEFSTAAGKVRIGAHLRMTDGVPTLCAGTGAAPALQQRRSDVRGRLAVPLRAAPADTLAERTFGDIVEGVTLDVSAGGLGMELHPRSRVVGRTGHLYLELALPAERVVPAVISVVDLAQRRLHGRFVDIAPVDREHLVHLIFAAQREELARRPRP